MILEYIICSIYEDITNGVILFKGILLFCLRKGIVLHNLIKLGRKHQNKRWKKRILWEKKRVKDPVDLDVVSEESQEEDNSSEKDYIPEEKKGKYEFNTFGKINVDIPE